MHTTGLLVSEHSLLELVLKLKVYKLLCTDQIWAQLIQAGGNAVHSEIHRLIISIWYKEELPQEWKESIIVFIYKNGW